MNKTYIYKLVAYSVILTFLFSCGAERMDNGSASYIEENASDTKNEADPSMIEELSITDKWDGMEPLVEQKLQEAIDLYLMLKDSVLPNEMKVEAEHALNELLTGNIGDLSIKKGEVKVKSITTDSTNREKGTVIYSINGKEGTSIVNIKRSSIEVDAQVLETVEVKIEEIK